ncbi:hypothetical protein DB41_CP00130 [Neochlamydia sp. TUME1]|nr:hypothetical protein DB41_CP00130 [Neochlamydia sp. TUME1]
MKMPLTSLSDLKSYPLSTEIDLKKFVLRFNLITAIYNWELKR